ncbi:hypothetical protein QUA54_16505 [Microcoleus sp. MOSTC5]|uniref:hypothetical protein n=1 Tax=Microcoleus sp. MOSTC5 TaxID=3055378 RepID=UPI002FD641AE
METIVWCTCHNHWLALYSTVTTGMTLGLPTLFTVLAWKNKNWSVVDRSHYSLITLAALAFSPCSLGFEEFGGARSHIWHSLRLAIPK